MQRLNHHHIRHAPGQMAGYHAFDATATPAGRNCDIVATGQLRAVGLAGGTLR